MEDRGLEEKEKISGKLSKEFFYSGSPYVLVDSIYDEKHCTVKFEYKGITFTFAIFYSTDRGYSFCLHYVMMLGVFIDTNANGPLMTLDDIIERVKLDTQKIK